MLLLAYLRHGCLNLFIFKITVEITQPAASATAGGPDPNILYGRTWEESNGVGFLPSPWVNLAGSSLNTWMSAWKVSRKKPQLALQSATFVLSYIYQGCLGSSNVRYLGAERDERNNGFMNLSKLASVSALPDTPALPVVRAIRATAVLHVWGNI